MRVPGSGGGANWSGAGADPDTGFLYVPSRSGLTRMVLVEGKPSCLCLADKLLAGRSLEGLGNGWARAPEQRGKEFGEVDEPLSCGADDASEDLLGLRAAGRPITATDFAVDDGGANGVFGPPVGGLYLGRPQEGEHGGELTVEMGGEALGGRQDRKSVV